MADFGSALWNKPAAAADPTPADLVTRSLRFNGSVSSSEAGHLYRTAGTPTDEGKWTMSMWVKVGQQPTNGYMTLFGAGIGNDNAAYTAIYNGNLYSDQAGSSSGGNSSNHRTIKCTGQLLRDPNAWYHLCFAYDNSQSGSSGNNQNAYKWYVNGVRVTEPTYSNNESVTGYSHRFNRSGFVQRIGKAAHRAYSSTYKYHWDGLIANVHFVDGQQLEPTDFIESNGYGGYKPKEYTGSYGNNGFHLDMQPSHDADLLVSSIGRNDGDTLFADAAAGHTLTTGGDPEHSIAVGNPFTGDDRAIYFDGSDDYLTAASDTDFDFSSGSYTYEGWFLFKDFNGTPAGIFGRNSTPTTNWAVHTDTSGLLKFFAWNTYYSSSFTFNTNQWYHIALCKNGTTYKVYVDGSEEISVTNSSSLDVASPLTIGRFYDNYADYYLTGYCYDFRAQQGTDTGGAVPSSKMSKTETTVFLLQPEKDDTDFHDESDSSHTITAGSSPTRTASTPYGAAAKSTAMYFDGSGDYLTVPTHDNLKPESGDFTVEAWINYSSIPDSSYGSVIYGVCGGAGGPSGDSLAFMLKPDGHLGLIYGDAHYTGSSSTAMSSDTWYHVALVRSSGTVKLYIDGDEDYSATHSGNLNNTTDNRIGARGGTPMYFDGYMYDLRFTKGSARYTSNFTAPSAPFELNPVYIGGDQSGNKNHFTPTNISGHDVLLDTPTKNYATLNPLQKAGSNGSDPSEGNLSLTGGSNPSKAFSSTIAVNSGKYYAEFHIEALGYPTVAVGDTSLWVDGYGSGRIQGNGVVAYDIKAASNTGQYFINSTSSSSDAGISPATDDIIQVAFDADTRKVWFGRNGTWNSSGDPANGTNEIGTVNGTDALAVLLRSEVHSSAGTTVANFGQDPTFAGGASSRSDSPDTSQGEFYFAPPENFQALNCSNLDDPTVTPSEHFNTILWEGNSTNNEDITGLDFDPTDGVLTWIKNRDDDGAWNVLFDSVRGAGNQLATNETDAELASASNIGGKVSQWNSDGFRVAAGSGGTPYKSVNESSDDYVAWNWKAHQSPSSSGSAKQKYKFYCEDLSGDDLGWDWQGYFTDNNGNPSINMEVLENQNGTRVSLGYVYVAFDGEAYEGITQTFTLECADIDAIEIRWHYDDSNDSTSDYTSDNNDDGYGAVNTILNAQRLTVYSGAAGTTQEFQVSSAVNTNSQDDGITASYSPPTGWADGDVIRAATASNTDSSTYASSSDLTDGFTAAPVEKYNSDAGFSIITYTGNGSSDGDTQEITHNLGAEPEFIIAKSRSSSSSNGTWNVYHKHTELSSSYGYGTHGYLRLDSSNAASEPYYDILIPKSGSENTIINTNYSSTDGLYTNQSGVDYVMYAFAPIEGYSHFGKYSGAGSDGVFVYTGHRPKMVWIKNTDTTGNWFIFDAARDTYNETVKYILANSSASEATNSGYKIDILSNGFRINVESTHMNNSAYNYVFCSWAEQPFAAPSNAR